MRLLVRKNGDNLESSVWACQILTVHSFLFWWKLHVADQYCIIDLCK